MTRREVLTILAVAIGTAGVTVGLLWPGGSVAQQALGEPGEIEQPVLAVAGCTLTLTAEHAESFPGQRPVLVLRATNPTSRPVDLVAGASLWAQEVPDPMSRRMPISQPVWGQSCPLALAPGETRTLRLTTVPLPAGREVQYSLSAAERGSEEPDLLGMPMGGFTVPAPLAAAGQQAPHAAPEG